MKSIFCIFSLCAIAIFWDFEQVKAEPNSIKRVLDCYVYSEYCRSQIKILNIEEEMTRLCAGKPLETPFTKCLMDGHMLQYGWIKDNKFQKDKYLEYVNRTELGQDKTYVEAAESAAKLCEHKKAPLDDSCETAYVILTCLQNEGNKLKKENVGYNLFNIDPHVKPFDK